MLKLVPFSQAHFETLGSWFFSEADLVQWGGPFVTFPLDAGQLGAMLAEAAASPPTRVCWMVESDGTAIGHAQLGLDWRNGVALLSRVAIAPQARGLRLALPMLRLVVDKAFAKAEIARVELKVYTWNQPAIRVYERLGFRMEGIRRSSARVGKERWDTAIMGLLRGEWLDGAAQEP
ncbi:GNAT family N-acetyltransferase [Novosphingobium sp.]|uniref:GNAT family N-acetyltransferase n=1 Tax=Novosphingobium sp. TaxID=1874826 RepID=UPI003BAC2515